MQHLSLVSLALPFAGMLLPFTAAAQEFAGPYAGLEAGYSRFDTTLLERIVTIPEDPATPVGRSTDSFSYAALGGWNFAAGQDLLLGVEGRIGDGGSGSVSAEFLDGRFTAEPGLSYDVSVRLGTVISGSTLLYGRVGYGAVELELNRESSGSAEETMDGIVLGAGIEKNISGALAARFDLSYADYGETASVVAAPALDRVDIEAESLRASLALIIRF